MRWPTSWSYYLRSFSSVGRKLLEELSGNIKVYRLMDGKTDGTKGYKLIRPFFKRAYKNRGPSSNLNTNLRLCINDTLFIQTNKITFV